MTAGSIAVGRLEARSLLRQSFLWMTVGLIFSAAVAWFTSQSNFLTDFVAQQPSAALVGLIAWVILTLGFNFLVRRLPFIVGLVLYIVYCAFTGLMLSTIFITYTDATIVYALVSTVALFAIITAFALWTTIDLTRWWMYIVFGILGMIVASVLNLVLFRSAELDLAISLIGVVLFSISTAATVQRIVKMEHELEPRLHDRAAIIGAMMLYTNFVNLFIRLLEIYGRSQKRS